MKFQFLPEKDSTPETPRRQGLPVPAGTAKATGHRDAAGYRLQRSHLGPPRKGTVSHEHPASLHCRGEGSPRDWPSPHHRISSSVLHGSRGPCQAGNIGSRCPGIRLLGPRLKGILCAISPPAAWPRASWCRCPEPHASPPRFLLGTLSGGGPRRCTLPWHASPKTKSPQFPQSVTAISSLRLDWTPTSKVLLV